MSEPQQIDATFTVKVTSDSAPGGWTVAVLPGSGKLLGTRRPVKVAGTLQDQPFEATLLPSGDGSHMLPIKAALRRATGVTSGDQVTVRLDHVR